MGFSFLFSMKVLILQANAAIPKNELEDLHATIVAQMRSTGTVLLPNYISICEFRDVDCFGKKIICNADGGGVRLFGQ